jgi:hypothetical protein
MVVAVVALVVALTGTAVATSSKLSGSEAKQVGKIANKRISKRAPKLTVARAHVADNATSLGGVAAAAYAQHADLAPVPESNLALHSDWQSIGGGAGAGPARGYRDQLGVVHLAGLIGRSPTGTDSVALTLPSNLRPGYDLEFAAVCDEPGIIFNPAPGTMIIDANGEVHPITTTSSNCYERLSLDGIAFRAGG